MASATHPANAYGAPQHLNTQEFLARLSRALRAYYPENLSDVPHYDSVSVLLLLWDDDDEGLKCRVELECLERTFRLTYGYSTTIAEIPSKTSCSETWLSEKVADFTRGKTRRDLVIVFYAGHGEATADNPCIWLYVLPLLHVSSK